MHRRGAQQMTTLDLIDFAPYISVPALATIQLGAVVKLARRSVRSGVIETTTARHFYALVTAWAVWGVVSAVLAVSGGYTTQKFYALMPGLWLPFVPVVIFAAYFALSSSLRNGLGKVIDHTPLHWLVYLHALRISAIGTAFETVRGTFPESFELLVGVPDLLFGLSALYVGWRVQRGSIGRRGVAVWSLVGAIAVVPGANLVAQMGLPGPMMVFTTEPTAAALFVYPMVLAPTLIVPLFVLCNLVTAQRLWSASRADRAVGEGPHRS